MKKTIEQTTVLTDDEKEVLKKVIESVRKCNLLNGIYDAKHGDISFMYGIECAMSSFAYKVSEEYGDEFETAFMNNITKSIDKVEKDECDL